MQMRSGKAAILSLLLLLVVQRGAAAQGVPQPVPTESRIPGWIFTPSLAVGGGWDDNVLLINPLNDPPRDYASPINPAATIDFTGRRTQFSSSYLGSFTFYRRIEELTSFEHSFRASFQQRLNPRITLFADENFSRAPTTEALQLAGVPFYRIGSRTNALAGGIDALLSKYTSVRARYTLRNVGFDFDQVTRRELLGGHANEVDLSLGRALSARVTVGAEYGFLQGTIGQAATDPLATIPTVPVTAPDRNFNIQNFRGVAKYRITPHVDVSGGFGVARLGGTLTQEAQTGPTVQAGVTYRAEYYLASMSYQRSFVPSFGFGGTFQNQEWLGSLHVPFARNRAYAESNLSWLSNEPLFDEQANLRSVWLSGKVGYRATRWLSVEGYYARAQQNSRRAGANLSRNQVGFQVVTSKPMKLE
jgi:hypothetical protein